MLKVFRISVLSLFAAVLLSNCTSDVTSPEPEGPEEHARFILDDIDIYLTNKYGCELECKETGYLEFTIKYHLKVLPGSIKEIYFYPMAAGVGKAGFILNDEKIHVKPDTLIELSSDFWLLDKFESIDSCMVAYEIYGAFWDEIIEDSVCTYGSFQRMGMKLVFLDIN